MEKAVKYEMKEQIVITFSVCVSIIILKLKKKNINTGIGTTIKSIFEGVYSIF